MKTVRELVVKAFLSPRLERSALTAAEIEVCNQADALDAELTRLRNLERQAYGYLSRVFLAINPQCILLPNLMGLCAQIDNSMTEITKLRAQLADARNDALEEAAKVCEQPMRFAKDIAQDIRALKTPIDGVPK